MKKNLLLLATALFAMMGMATAQGPVTTFFEGFEDGTLGVMTLIDADGDGRNWANSSTLQAQGDGHDGSLRYAYSESWGSLTRPPLNPDNFLVSPQIAVNSTTVFTFFVCSDWYAYVGEHYGVAISTASNTDPNDFTTIAEWDLTDKGTRDDDQGPWHEHNIDLSQYAGQNVYVAIRHFYCSNIYRIDVDDISVTSEETGGCEAPTNLRGTQDGTHVEITWDEPEGSPAYYLYRHRIFQDDTDDNFTVLITDANFSDELLENTVTTYKVTAVYLLDDCESDFATTPDGDDNVTFTTGDLGTKESSIEADIYPNPSNHAFSINCEGMTKLTVYGMRGETIIDVNISADNYVITDLVSGVYFVRIETATGSMTQKIVKL